MWSIYGIFSSVFFLSNESKFGPNLSSIDPKNPGLWSNACDKTITMAAD